MPLTYEKAKQYCYPKTTPPPIEAYVSDAASKAITRIVWLVAKNGPGVIESFSDLAIHLEALGPVVESYYELPLQSSPIATQQRIQLVEQSTLSLTAIREILHSKMAPNENWNNIRETLQDINHCIFVLSQSLIPGTEQIREYASKLSKEDFPATFDHRLFLHTGTIHQIDLNFLRQFFSPSASGAEDSSPPPSSPATPTTDSAARTPFGPTRDLA